MIERTVNVMVGGAAGQGLATVGQLLSKCLMRAGYDISVTQDFMSRVRGGHNTFSVRTGTKLFHATADTVDILVALNQESVDLHLDELSEGGLVFCDDSLDANGHPGLAIPFKDLAPKPIFQNVAGLGVLAGTLGLDKELPAQLLRQTFGRKGDDIVNMNLEVLDAAYAWLEKQDKLIEPLEPVADPQKRIMITANEAICMGALAAGVRFCSFYPMTPSTSIAQNLISHGKKMGVVVEQAEDEIAAMNMGIGAAYAGARTLVPTSGGGFALMTEGISLAGVAEVPLVNVVAMRPGPATGLPTRTEQADLNLVLYAGHGEFPRAIFAPTTHEECFELTHKAFDLAERYNTPMFVFSDQYMANSFRSVPPLDGRSLPAPAEPLREWDETKEYEPYAITDSGVSPRLIPGATKAPVLFDSHEHTPDGHITEDIDMRNAMQDKRLRKGIGLKAEAVAPSYVGDDAPDALLICWGSTRGAAEEAAALLRAGGTSAATLSFGQVWPLNPDQFLDKLKAAKQLYVVEGNSTGQFANLLKLETCIADMQLVLKYDGRAFTAGYILRAIAGENPQAAGCGI